MKHTNAKFVQLTVVHVEQMENVLNAQLDSPFGLEKTGDVFQISLLALTMNSVNY